MRKSLFFKALLLLILPAVIVAQSATTGAIAGVVVNNDGTPLPGVAITAVHMPTGTTFMVISRTGGLYLIPAVKAGGPYTVTAVMTGFRTEKKTGITVKLGEKAQVAFGLQLATVDVGEIIVTGVADIINKSRTGATQNVGQNVIEDLPTISRTLSDFTRLAPQFASGEDAGSFVAAGRNSKYNNVQVDGAQNNDLFGLDLSGTPGGQAESTPISIDVVQEFQIVLAPFDVRYGGFTGGGINVITKSGTNEFHGSVYYEGRNESLVGNGPSDYEFDKFSDATYGVSLGGPIIKNKLFFFFNAEQTLAKTPEDIYIDGSGADYDFGHKAEADRVISILKGYGYDPGGYGQVSNETKSQKIFFRLDWNINDKHRLTLRNNYVKSSHERLDRSDLDELWLGNAGRIYKNNNNSTVLQLNSTFSEKLFNEFILNVTSIHDDPTYMGEAFPNLTINTDSGVTFKAGSEEYRMRNDLKQDLIEITDNLTMYSGKHTYIFGTHNEFFSFYNVFIQREFGKYSFDSIDDLENGIPSYFDRYYSITNDPNQPAEFGVAQLGFYAGDEWAINDKLTLTYGLRADVPLMSATPPENTAVEASFGYATNQNAGGNWLISPRLGFNFDAKGDGSIQIRGGIGIFSGRAPYVWISNQFSNTATEIARYKVYGDPGFFITDPYGQPDNPSAVISGDINLIEKNFKFPQVLRMNFAVDKKLPLGFTGTFEALYSKNINEVKFQNINVAPTGATLPDGRPLFGTPSTSKYGYSSTDRVDSGFGNVILLSNTNEGYEYSLTFQLQKLWAGNMINAAYTYGEAKSLFGGTSSRAISNWKYNVTGGDPNNPKLSWSPHDTRHRFMFALTKQFNFIKKAATSLSLFYNGRSGRPYSTRYYNDANGDGVYNDSIYVPATSSDVILLKGTWADLDKYISDDPALDENRGKILPRNASRDKWSHFVDLKIIQNIPLPLKGKKLQFSFTVENFLNMLNKDWGVYKYISYDDTPLVWRGVDSTTGLPMMEFQGRVNDDERFTINQILSRWKGMFGIRFTF